MNEGWVNDDYLILFDESEIASVSDRYSLSQFLPGFQVLGLSSWDDFIVRDAQGKTFSTPTVPIDRQYLSPFVIPERIENLSPDARFSGKIKWYLKPLVFGGDPTIGENVAWVSLEEHAHLVRWWNVKHRSDKSTGQATPRS